MLNETKLKFFADYIQRNLGIVYQSSNFFQLEKRLEDIAKSLNFPDVEELYFKAISGIDEPLKQLLLDSATNNETSFFRDPAIYKAIGDCVFDSWRLHQPRKSMCNIWSCASSFGQEPYSLAMLSDEYSALYPGGPSIQIIASDISDNALTKARSGKYSQLEVQRGLSPQRLVKYFTKDQSDYWELSASVRSKVRFFKQNLLDPFISLGQLDLVMCRYVLIYQTDEKKKEIIAKISKVLAPRGFLALGGAESMIGLSDDFEQLSRFGAILYQKKF